MEACVSDCKNITGNQIHPNLQDFVGVSSQPGCSLVGDAGFGAVAILDFITTWTTTIALQTITLPATSISNNFDVDWGDGSAVETVITANPTHEYATADTYTITIKNGGSCPSWSFNDGGDKLFIDDIVNWGDVGFVDLLGAFYGCVNMSVSATDSGNFSIVTTMSRMFRSASIADPDVSTWDVSSVTNIDSMFRSMLIADPDVSAWDVSSVVTMIATFDASPMANPDVSTWDVSSVTNMSAMFRSAPMANPDVSAWNVSNVSNMTTMFLDSAFSDANYDLLLSAWSLLTLQSAVSFHAGIAKYTEVAARAILTNAPNLWVITDGGPA